MSQVWIETVGRNLRLLRESRGWSQAYVAQRLRDITGDAKAAQGKEMISSIERGAHTPPWDKMLHLARFFEMTIEALAELETGTGGGSHTNAEVIYVQHLHGNCVLGGLGLALDPEAVRTLVEFFQGHAEVLEPLVEALRTRGKGDGAA